MAKKVLITGASGLLGRAIFRELTSDKTWQVLGLAFSRAGGDLKQVDLRNKEAVEKVIQDFQPNIIIHSAAERKPDVVEKQPDLTKQLNLDATRYLCEAAKKFGAWVFYISTSYVFDGKKPPYSESDLPNPINKYGLSKYDGEKITLQANEEKLGAWVVYISTDYVFDGTKPPYLESDLPNPLNKYGLSKYDGEKITLEVSEGNAVLRVPILYGQISTLDESAVTVLFEKVKDTTKKCVMSDYERRYPTHCDDIAFVLREMADRQIKDKSLQGVYHWSGNENMTKYDMAVTMATVFGISTNHIEADKNPSSGAPRPFNSQLSCGRVEKLGINKRTTFSEEIKKILQDFV